MVTGPPRLITVLLYSYRRIASEMQEKLGKPGFDTPGRDIVERDNLSKAEIMRD